VSILEAYLKGDARDLFGAHPGSADDRAAAVRRAERPLEPAVLDALAAQNARYEGSRARDAHLDALRRGAAAVGTGPQAGLFLGPLYTVYKAASAIRVAEALAAQSGRAVVPVFWLQSEDHDLAEIAVCHVARANGESLDLALPAPPESRTSIAHLTLPDEVGALLESLSAEIGGLPEGAAHLARLARHYRPGASWSAAFAGVLAELFGPEGLVIVDPRDPVLARAGASVHREAIERADEISRALAERSRAIEGAGFEPAVHVRESGPLSFFHPDGPAGPRYRLVRAEGGFAEVGGTRTHPREALLASLASDPLTFSTSALLRPILEDRLLPTAAYVGGPGEVAYFAQLAPLYESYGIPMPLVVPRASFRVVDGPASRLLERLGLAADDAGLPEDEVLAKCRVAEAGAIEPAEVESRILHPFEAALLELSPSLEAAGEGLDVATAKTRESVRSAVGKLAKKYEKALLHRDRALVADVAKARGLLFPGGIPQERVYGLPSFAARSGDRAFVSRVLAAVVPFDATRRDLS
jgi:bacillithiol biosynthesis cysteine-adding enzyme BshC